MDKVYIVMMARSTWEGDWDIIVSIHKDYAKALCEADELSLINTLQHTSYYVQDWMVK